MIDVDSGVALVCSCLAIIVSTVAIIRGIHNFGRKEGGDDQKMNDLSSTVLNLPCIKDPNYMQNMGELKGIIQSFEYHIKQASDGLAATNQRLDRWVDKNSENRK